MAVDVEMTGAVTGPGPKEALEQALNELTSKLPSDVMVTSVWLSAEQVVHTDAGAAFAAGWGYRIQASEI